MTMLQNFFILTEAQHTQARSLDADGIAEVDARQVDHADPGVGINLNDDAAAYAPGDPVTLMGSAVLPKTIVNNPLYMSNCAELISFLLTLPWASLAPATIFMPSD